MPIFCRYMLRRALTGLTQNHNELEPNKDSMINQAQASSAQNFTQLPPPISPCPLSMET